MKKLHWFTTILFAIVFCLTSLVNHYNFRTYAYDLGLETNAAYDYAHFRVNDCMLMEPYYKNYLSDHFSVDLIFISPVIYFFGTYGLLVAQIAAIILGGLGIYKYVLQRMGDLFIANMALIHFFVFWGIFGALQFDYHNNVIGAMAVPWIFYFIELRKIKQAAIALAVLLLSKENMAFWAFFLMTGMAITYRNDKKIRNALLLFGGVSLVYFFTVVNVIIPWLANAGRNYNHLHYSALGNSFGDIILRVIKVPHIVLDLFFKTTSTDPMVVDIKTETHMFVFLSGGFALIYKPQYLWMLLPIYAQKLFNDDPAKWGIGLHYNIEFTPVLTIAVAEFVIAYVQKPWMRRVVMLLAMTTGIIATASALQKNHSLWYNFQNTQFYKKEHYETPFDKKELYSALKMIPDKARVSATIGLVPHLCLRDFIYLFPNEGDSEYVLILRDGNNYPLNQEELADEINQCNADSSLQKIYDFNSLLIYKRR